MASQPASYAADVSRPDLIRVHHEGCLVGLVERRATGWVARPCQAGRRASTKRWAEPEDAAKSMWGIGAAEAVWAAWHEALIRAAPKSLEKENAALRAALTELLSSHDNLYRMAFAALGEQCDPKADIAAKAARELVEEDEPEPWDGPDFCGSGT